MWIRTNKNICISNFFIRKSIYEIAIGFIHESIYNPNFISIQP